jgi:hypothetical protein
MLEPHLEVFAPDEAEWKLDPGIRRGVLILRSAGIETYESCEGGEGHSYPVPTISFRGSAWAGYHAFSVAMEHGLPVTSLRRVYDVLEAQLQGPWWEMTFRAAAPSN